MKKITLPLFVLVAFVLCAFMFPQRVSHKCARQRTITDAGMRSLYGDYIFDHWFEFDKGSYVWGDENYLCEWNDWFRGDTISRYNFRYRFHFPGAQVSPTYVYGIDLNYKGELTEDTTPHSFTGWRGRYITQQQMEAITQEHLGRSLGSCNAVLWTQKWYSADSAFIHLDTMHAFIEVTYRVRKGGKKRGEHFEVWEDSILVDAYIGTYVASKTWHYEGTVGYF